MGFLFDYDIPEREVDCHMLMRDGNCSGMISPNLCGPDCPFKKSWKEQRDIEWKIVDRFDSIDYIGVYRSCIDNSILYKNDGTSKHVYI